MFHSRRMFHSKRLVLGMHPGSVLMGCVVGMLLMHMYNRIRVSSTWVLLNSRQVIVDRPVFTVDLTDSHRNKIPNNQIAREEYSDSHHEYKNPNVQIARKEYNDSRVLCWVMTNPKNHKTKCKPIKETWGKRCNILLFMSSETDESLPAIGLKVPEGRDNLWLKTKAAFKYVLKHYQYQAEWFLKADDDTYVIVENLRHFLSYYDTEKPYYFGRKFKLHGTFNSGGAGYVFSRETLRRFGNIIEDKRCPENSAYEDVEVARCLAHSGVFAGHTLDARDREMFHSLQPEHHLVPGFSSARTDWLWKFNFKPYKDGPECCSDYSCTFHYITPNMMYQLDYLIYRLRAFGVEQT